MNVLGPVTTVHRGLWHYGFIVLCVVAMLLHAAAYMLLMVHPAILRYGGACAAAAGRCGQAAACLAYALGLFFFGPVANWLVQRYRRGMVCRCAVAGFAVCALASYLFFEHWRFVPWTAFVAVRFMTGAFFGLSGMVLLSTLIVDKTESAFRTLANHTAAWMSRLGMVVGALLSVVVFRNTSVAVVCLCACGVALLAFAVLVFVKFPFKTPDEDVARFSSDRFLMPRSTGVFALTCASFAVYGVIAAEVFSVTFFVLVMLGFLWVLVLEHYVSIDSVGMRQLEVSLLFAGAGVASIVADGTLVPRLLGPGLLGAGIGMMAACSQLLLIGRSGHCRRGTAVSTSFLACESGVALGVAAAVSLLG